MRMEREPVDSTDKDTIIWELIVSTEAGLDTQCHWPSLFTDGTSWNVNLEPMTLPVAGVGYAWSDLYFCLSNDVSSSDDWECWSGVLVHTFIIVSLCTNHGLILTLVISLAQRFGPHLGMEKERVKKWNEHTLLSH